MKCMASENVVNHLNKEEMPLRQIIESQVDGFDLNCATKKTLIMLNKIP